MDRAMFSDTDTEWVEAKLAYLGFYSLRSKMSCQQIPLTYLPPSAHICVSELG